MKQKSVSPIIATILLIVVVVAITTIVLNWGVDFVSRSTEAADDSIDFSCIGVNLKISSCDYDSEDNTVTIVVTNTGKKVYPEKTTFYAVLTDTDNNLETVEDIFDEEPLAIGQSKMITLDGNQLNYPITVRVNSNICPTADSRIICRWLFTFFLFLF